MTNFVFLHGGGQGGWVWAETIAALEAQSGGDVGILVLDAPGCGTKRQRDTTGLAQIDVARELVADVERSEMADVVLVGHSQAGQTLPFMAKLRPDLFSGLVHVSCSIPLSGQTVGDMIGDCLQGSDPDKVGWPLDPETTDIADRLAAMFSNDMTQDQAAAFLQKLGSDMWPMQTYMETDWPYDDFGVVPSSYIVCRNDQALPASWQEIFADRLKVDRRIWIDAGHQVMNTRPHGLAEILRYEGLAFGA